MPILIWGLVLVGVVFIVHVLVWRWRLPRRQTRALSLLFFGGLALQISALAWLAPSDREAGWWWLSTLPQFLHLALFVTAFTLAYIVTYTAVEVDSPSLLIVLEIARAGPAGLPAGELERQLDDELLVTPRIRDLLRDGMAVQEGQRLKLSAKGRSFIRTFILFRKLLGLGKGG